MAYTRVKLLFVLTLLQLCRAEISNNDKSDNLPEWYSANVINDGFQPKSISEIFSTESPPFSSTNPIVVLPKFTSTTVAPPISIAGDITKTSIIPVSSTTLLPDTVSTLPPQTPTDFSSRFPSQTPQVEITQFTEQTHPSPSRQEILSDLRHTSPSLSPYTLDHQTTLQQSTPSILPYSLDQQTTLLQDPSSSPLGRFVVPLKAETDFSTTLQQSTSPTPEPLPNYFVVYQKTPQSLPSLSLPNSLQGGLFGGGPQKSTTVVIQPTTTASPQTNLPGSTFVSSTSERPTTVIRTSRDPTTGRPTTVELSTPKTTILDATAGGTHYPARPLPVRIRVVGPRGSITHVNINPPITALALTSTTKRPSATRTRKTPKPKRNSYEACLSGCKVKRDPICAIPLSATWIDADKLKGFPSVCHMACFNSYKKEPYEKILDGRCGRLRTRIQTFDSKTKMTRQELNKSQYTIDNGDHTIVEVSALHHK